MADRPADAAHVSRRGFLRASVLVGGGGLGGASAVEALRTAAHDVASPPQCTAGYADPRALRLDVRDFGATGDGTTDDTLALQQALDAAHQRGGGTVVVGPGRFLSTTLALRSFVTLDLAPGAVLVAAADDARFAPPERLPFRTRSDLETVDFAHALLAGRDLERVAITGAGIIDMNRRFRAGPKPIALKSCRFVTVQGITILRSPNYCVSLGGCDDVVVDGVTIREAFSDGIDPDCCRRVRISNCDVESDDDALCLKASFLLGRRAATEDVVVTGCRLRSPSNCFKLGTESTGDFRQVVLTGCVFSGLPPQGHDVTSAAEGGGVAILTVDGGTVDGVVVSNVVMRHVVAPVFVRLGNRGRDQTRRTPGRLRNVSIAGIVAMDASDTGSIVGLADQPADAITVENVRIEVAGGARRKAHLIVPEREARYPTVSMFGRLPAFGLYMRHVRDVTVRNVHVTALRRDTRPALVADDVRGLQLSGFAGRCGGGAGPMVWLHEVRRSVLQGNVAPENVGVYLRVTGKGTAGVTLLGNTYRSRAAVELAPELSAAAVTELADRALPPGVARDLG